MSLKVWSKDTGVEHMGSIGLRGHQVHEKYNSDDAVIWDVVQNKTEEHLDNREQTEDGPETQPIFGCFFTLAFNGLDGHEHWINASQKRANNVISLQNNTH